MTPRRLSACGGMGADAVDALDLDGRSPEFGVARLTDDACATRWPRLERPTKADERRRRVTRPTTPWPSRRSAILVPCQMLPTVPSCVLQQPQPVSRRHSSLCPHRAIHIE